MPTATVAAVSVTTTDRAVGAAWQGRLDALADHSLGGRAFCRRLAAATDVWIEALATNAREQHPRAPRFALLAVGGFGRGELSPQSDLDLLLVHDSKSARLEEVASAIWYPVWDAGLKLGHAVRSVAEQIDLAKHDLDTATALLTARLICGDAKLGGQVIEHGLENWKKRRKQWLELLQQRVRERQASAGEVAYILEPDVKDGHGGIRDVQSLWWAECAGLALSAEDDAALNECYDVLLDARVAGDAWRPFAEGLEPKHSLLALREAGIEFDSPQPAGAPVVLIELASAERPSDFRVALRTFYVITRYNRSAFYAAAVADLAKELRHAYDFGR
jgi:UTP:GlnB (protein PII) uridylyltransferase